MFDSGNDIIHTTPCLDCKPESVQPLLPTTLVINSPDNSIIITPTTVDGKTVISLSLATPSGISTQNDHSIEITGTGVEEAPLKAALVLNPAEDNAATVGPSGLYVAPSTGGGNTDAENIGLGGIDVFKQKVDDTLQLRKVKQGNNVTVSLDGDTIKIDAAGEANAAANVGGSGVGLFKDKTGSNLNFKKVAPGSNVTFDTTDPNVIIVNATGGGSGSSLIGDL